MADCPLLFRFRHVVRTPNYEVLVAVTGRAVIGMDDDAWWCDGVEPGCLTQEGDGPAMAFERFRAAFSWSLDDLAEGCSTLEEFRRDAEMFFRTSTDDETRWHSALRRIRDGAVIEDPFRHLPRLPWNGSSITIETLQSLAATPLASFEPEISALPEAA